jgi:penicillin-binding protein 1C
LFKRRKNTKKILKLLVGGFALLAAVWTVVLALAWHWYPFPMERLQRWPAGPVVLDARGNRLFSLVGRDGQWRYPIPLAEISPWLIEATIATEDQRFYRHPGVDCRALLRALGQNLLARRVVSGASTLDMQLCRMMDDRPRTLGAKII